LTSRVNPQYPVMEKSQLTPRQKGRKKAKNPAKPKSGNLCHKNRSQKVLDLGKGGGLVGKPQRKRP